MADPSEFASEINVGTLFSSFEDFKKSLDLLKKEDCHPFCVLVIKVNKLTVHYLKTRRS